MSSPSTSPFETIESAQEYISLLEQALLESQQTIEADIGAQNVSASSRRVQALHLIVYNLNKLSVHMNYSTNS